MVSKSDSMYGRLITKRVVLLVLLLLLLLFGALYSITLGVANISISQVYGVILKTILGLGTEEYPLIVSGIVLKIRLPRVLLAIIAGISLGANGAIMQSILRNPLASPYTLGVSSGAALGAGLTIVLGNHLFSGSLMAQYGSWLTIIGAFVMGLLTIFLINVVASIKGGGVGTLILAGVALSYLFSAGISFLKYIADPEELTELTVWLMGGLYRSEWLDVIILTPILVLGLIFILRLAWDINALNAGEEVATNLGVDVYKLRRRGSILAAILTSCVVAFTGIIGFIGLITPHLCRMIFGNDNRYLLVASGLLGAFILLTADTAARLIINPTELPVGIITSIFGAPFFIYILLQRRRKHWA